MSHFQILLCSHEGKSIFFLITLFIHILLCVPEMGAVSQYLKVYSRFVKESNPESSLFMEEFRLYLIYSHPTRDVVDFFLVTSLSWYYGTTLRSALSS